MTSAPFRYAAAIAMGIAAILIQLAAPSVFRGMPFFLFFVAVFLSALVAGLGPAITETIFATLLTAYFFHPGAIQTALFFVTGIVVSWFVSSSRRWEEAQKNAEVDHLLTIANVAPAIVWITDAEKKCTYVNDRWLEFSGRTREEELGFGWLSEIHEDDIPACMERFERAFASRKPVDIEYRHRRHDGVYRWMLSRGVPRTGRNGVFAGYIGVALDIDDLRASEKEQKRLSLAVSRERERLLGLVSNVPGVVWEAWGNPDKDSQLINFVSEHVERMLGYTVEEWLSTPNFWLTIVHPDDREAAAKHAHDHYLAGGAMSNTFRWMTKDGRAIWCEAHSTVIQDEDGAPVGMRGVTLDISARRRAEASLRFAALAGEALASSIDYDATLKATAGLAVPELADWCVVALVEEDGQPHRAAVVHADPKKNELAQKLLTIPRRQDMPAEIAAQFAKMQPFILEMNDEMIRSTAYDDAHAALVSELGAASSLIAPIESQNRYLGTISFVSATPGRYDQRDIELGSLLARRVAIAIDNAQLYRAAVHASAAKDEFLATVSHELRTPMTATLGWVRLLALGNVDAETQKTGLHAIENSTRAQAKLIDDILDVSTIILGKFRLERGPVDLRAVIDSATDALKPALTAKSIAMDVDTSRWTGAIQGDASRLQQVFWNLLANAVKFARRDGCIEVILERDEGVARITVRDDGAGIDPSFLPHVFDRFRQAEGGSTRKHGGLGLGLAIVRHLVELHGGSVQASSDGQGKGATFIVELPATLDVARTNRIDVAALPDLGRKQILVVDDEQPTLDLVATVLRHCGARVTTARSADEALLALNAGEHDLLITDIAMPGTDGLTMMVRVHELKPSLPAIALSARSDVPRTGFARVLRKPIDPIELASQIAQVIAGE
jgi:PAS domain S-box-containing protein